VTAASFLLHAAVVTSIAIIATPASVAVFFFVISDLSL
jgi:hypothetical protein